MSISLPARANAEFLRKQSKELRQAFANGDDEALSRIHQYLPRAGKLEGQALREMSLSLQEAQHALACAYGFDKWEEMMAAVDGPRFDDLMRLTDREAQILLREVDQRELVHALIDVPRSLIERFLGNMSESVKGYIVAEMGYVRDLPVQEIESARRVVLDQVLDLIEQGWITWPPQQAPTSSSTAPVAVDDQRLQKVAQPLMELSPADLAQLLGALAELARDSGILALESSVRGGKGTLLSEGIQLVVDGTEPALVANMLGTRAATILRNHTIRGQMTIEGWMSIYSGDNPQIVAQKLTSFFVEEPEYVAGNRGVPSIDDLITRIQEPAKSRTRQVRLVELFRDMASHARQHGVSALAPLVELVDDSALAAGMQAATVQDAGAGDILQCMETELHEQRVGMHRRHCLVVKGIAGIEAGMEPAILVADALQWSEDQATALERIAMPRL